MIDFDKAKVRDSLTLENIFDLLTEWGGDPEYTGFGILSSTICHNLPGEGSKKLYYYDNSGLFKCYTGCDSTFDIFELVMKVMLLQHSTEYDLNDAVRYIASKIGFYSEYIPEDTSKLEDWKFLDGYERIQSIENVKRDIVLKEYDKSILDRLNYDVQLTPWLKEGINREVLKYNKIGFFPGTDQITIPHFDKNNRFIGLRGRFMSAEDVERYGKYRPMKINNQLYNHPLGMNLYNLNNSQSGIKTIGKAIVFEGEKSSLLYQTYFGIENDISVACCGSNISAYQIQLLQETGAKEIVVAFDRQFQEIGDKEFQHLKKNLISLNNKYKNYVNISFIFDKHMTLQYKDSPIDEGKEKFLQLFKDRISL
jgi:hypothetical protein